MKELLLVKKMKKSLLFILAIAVLITSRGQNGYQEPTDSLVKENLEKWQDLKFGIIIHWGLYSELGIVESWGLCSEDQDFQDRKGMPYEEYKEMYFNLISKFNPQQFNPDQWAEAAKGAGMKYLIFTTKHHDGFCLFDTKQTDFKITSEKSPFHNNPKADITKYVFKSFREKDFLIGAYFSKPDWHCPDYWSPLLATPDRNNNYDIRKYPARWESYKKYTHAQINELTSQYGKVNILWLDGGWVRPDSTITNEVLSWGYRIPEWNPDIDMPQIAAKARENQPGLIIVDRTVHGPYEDYRTPEQSIPDSILPYPWETCMTMTSNWGYVFNADYKPLPYLLFSLIDVVSKGGNFLLNVAPSPQGLFDNDALDRLKGMGDWMKINGQAIYNTRPFNVFGEGNNIRFTQSKDKKTIFVFLMQRQTEKITIQTPMPQIKKRAYWLGTQEKVYTSIENGKLQIQMPSTYIQAGKRPQGLPVVIKLEVK